MGDMAFSALRLLATVLGLFIMLYVVPLLNSVWGSIKDERLRAFIELSVQAAQQTLVNNADKRAYVEKLAIDWLAGHGMKMDGAQLDMLIESAVGAMKGVK